MSAPLQDKVALVAGATRGAGRGIAVELGAAGATVYVTGHQCDLVPQRLCHAWPPVPRSVVRRRA